MPLIDTNRYSEAGAWRRWRGGLGLGMVPNVPGAVPRGKPTHAFATPPTRGFNPYGKAAPVPVTAKTTAFIAPVAPPTSNLPMPQKQAVMTPPGYMQAPTQKAPLPQPGTLIFGTGLTPMNPNGPAAAARGSIPGTRLQPGGLPQGLKLPTSIPQGATPRTPFVPTAMIPNKAGHVLTPPAYKPPSFQGDSYTVGVPYDTAPAAMNETTDPSTILSASDAAVADFGTGGGGSGGGAFGVDVGAGGGGGSEPAIEKPEAGVRAESSWSWGAVAGAGALVAVLAVAAKAMSKGRRKGGRR